MPRIKIIPEAVKPMVPTPKDLSREVPRFKPAGGKPSLPMDKSYNRQGVK
jgi:hypothetical protein